MKLADIKNEPLFWQWANEAEHTDFNIHKVKAKTLSAIWRDKTWDSCKYDWLFIQYEYKGVPVEVKVVDIAGTTYVEIMIYAEVKNSQDNPYQFCGICYKMTARHPIKCPAEFIEDVSNTVCSLVNKGYVDNLITVSETDYNYYLDRCNNLELELEAYKKGTAKKKGKS